MKILYLIQTAVLLTLQGLAQSRPVTLDVLTEDKIKTGARQTDLYLPMLKGRSVALVGNQTSIIGKTHLVDSLLKHGVKISRIFFPEHGFRGTEDAGEALKTYKDKKTGIECVSLYGKENKKPTPQQLKDIDVVLFDLQDVGVRFYTYISTLHYVMESCAELNKKLIVLDRPNPNGHYVDGPVLEEGCKSFVGMHPVPLIYGMTIGEYARMINGEGWIKKKCDLVVIPLVGYTHMDYYELPVRPSPNLPTMSSVYLYPSLCLFEGTCVSVGRGTDKPFQQFGYPGMKSNGYSFKPKPNTGAQEPLYKGMTCDGYDVSLYGEMYMKYNKQLYLFWIIQAYKNAADKETFFNPYFRNLAGTEKLKEQIIKGLTEEEIRKSWEPGLSQFKAVRKKYLLYKDFE